MKCTKCKKKRATLTEHNSVNQICVDCWNTAFWSLVKKLRGEN